MTNRMLLALAMAFALVGCKKSESKKAEETPAEVATKPSDPAPTAPEPPPAAAPEPTAPAPSAEADPELMKAAEAYVRKNAAKGVEFTLTAEAVEGDFARLKVTPKKPDDGAIVFMKRKGKSWTGVDMGTSIPCADLEKEGFPPAVEKGCD